MPDENKLPVQMIHAFKPYMKDPIYKTGDWLPGQIKLIEQETAKKMLRHVDVYGLASAEDAAKQGAEVIAKVVKDTEDDNADQASQDLRDRVNKMSRTEVIEYAGVHYKYKIAGNLSVEKARAVLVQHIDLAGAK